MRMLASVVNGLIVVAFVVIQMSANIPQQERATVAIGTALVATANINRLAVEEAIRERK